jgi:hypothetical protein
LSYKPYYTSCDLINAVKRKISFPTSTNTFSPEDILAFANEEMMISQVPQVLLFHEEYFVTSVIYPLRSDTNRYPIPWRAIGMKLRGVFWCDPAGNLFEMTRIQADDKAFFQRSIGANQAVHKFYLENNDIVLTPSPVNQPSGSLVVYYFMRPNQLVMNDRAAIISSFNQQVVINNAQLNAGDTLTISSINQNIYLQPTTPAAGGNVEFINNQFEDINVYFNQPIITTTIFTAVTGSPATPTEFLIGASSIQTASNLATVISANGIVSASSGNPATSTVNLNYFNIQTAVTSANAAMSGVSPGMVVSPNTTINFQSVPSIFQPGLKVDMIQTDAGHLNRAIDIQIPPNGVSGNTMTFQTYLLPYNLQVGDYVCLAQESIIPQIPSDIHNGLAERVCQRILESIGDAAGLQAASAKMADIQKAEGTLMDQRVEGSAQKITGRHGILRYLKTGVRRRV